MDTNSTAGYTLNGTAVLPLGSAAVPPGAPRDAKRIRRRLRRRFLLPMLIPLLVCALIFVAPVLLPSTREIEIVPSSATIGIDGEDVAVLVYHDDDRPGVLVTPFQMRVAAIRLSDGRELWDIRLNEELIGDAVVLAGDDSWVYIGSDDGLVILDAATGAVRVEGDGVPGLGADVVRSASAYGYDPEANAVVALTSSGALVQIPVGDTQAVPADAAVTSRWRGELAAEPFLDETTLTQQVDEAATPDGTRFEIVSVSEAVQRDALVITSVDPAQIVRTEFVEASLLPVVAAGPPPGTLLETGQFLPDDDVDADGVVAPAGAGQGVVIVQHRESVNVEGMQLSSVDSATGQVIDTVEMKADALRALTGPFGTTAVIAPTTESWQPNHLLVLEDDGSFRPVEVGALNWWKALFE